MIIETKRLIIREFVIDDLLQVHDYASDPSVVEHMIWGPNSKQETEQFIQYSLGMQQQVPRYGYEFAVTLRDTEQLIGGCGIHVSDPKQGEIGYCFNKSVWNQGFATESAASLLKFGFEKLDLHRIYATCRPGNIGSRKVLEKIGMKFEGRLREHLWHKGKWHDSYQYSILKHEYFEDVADIR